MKTNKIAKDYWRFSPVRKQATLLLFFGWFFAMHTVGYTRDVASLNITRLSILSSGHVVIDFTLHLPDAVPNGRVIVFRNIPGSIFYNEVWRSDLNLPQVFQASVTDNGANANLRSEAFFVVAFDRHGTTIATSTAHRTPFLRAPQPDLCSHALHLEWEDYQITTSAGVPVALPVPFQSVEVQISTDGALFNTVAQLPHSPPGALPRRFLTATLPRGRYFLRVRAVDPVAGLQAFSNVQIVDFFPPYIENFAIDFIDVVENTEIRGGFSAAGDVNAFRFGIWRSREQGANFVQIDTMAIPGAWTDSPDLAAGPWFYRITAHHRNIVCPRPAFTTTHVSSLFLDALPGAGRNEIKLQWRHYPPMERNHHYILYQYLHGFWEEIAILPDTDNPSFFHVPIAALLGQEWKFKAEAVPLQGYHQVVASNFAVLEASNPVVIPNAFRPNSSIVENRVFLPVFVGFVPVEYQLIIFDRSGHTIFTTTDPARGWDGSTKNGNVSQGVYSFLLRYRDPAGTWVQEKGVVLLVE